MPFMRIGTVAVRSFDQEALYLAVPPRAIIDEASARRDKDLEPLYAELGGTLDSFHVILVFLLHERAKGPASLWYPYIGTAAAADDDDDDDAATCCLLPLLSSVLCVLHHLCSP